MSATFYEAIVATLGPDAIVPESMQPGRIVRFSTNGKRSDTSGWAKPFEDGRGGVFGDFRMGVSETWSMVDKRTMTPAERALFARQIALAAHDREMQQHAKHRANASYIHDLMGSTQPVRAGDPVARYLERRGLGGAWHFAPGLRTHSGLVYMHEGARLGVLPAMLAPLLAPDGSLVAVHRTYLTPEGFKADVPTVKKLTPAAGSLRGAAIRLQEPRDGVLGVAEGIETALAASLGSNVPTWSTYSAGGLAGFAWPDGIRKLIVFGDNDDAGRKAATELRDRARTRGLACSIMTPTTAGQDWADVYAAEVRA